MPLPVIESRREWIFSVMLVWYRGQVLGQVRELAADHPTDAEDQREGEDDHGDDGNHAIDVPTPQQQHRRPERKTQQDGESHRNKDFPPEIERCNGNDADGQGTQTRWRGLGGVESSGRKSSAAR